LTWVCVAFVAALNAVSMALPSSALRSSLNATSDRRTKMLSMYSAAVSGAFGGTSAARAALRLARTCASPFSSAAVVVIV
jgi:hypothetical protein